MSAWLGLTLVVALTLLTGWCVAGEFAYVAARRVRLEELAAGGDRKARRALEVMKRLSFMLSGAQLGITVTALGVGFVAAPAFEALLGPLLATVGLPAGTASSVAIGAGFVLSTVIQMVLGELGPKNLAIALPEQVARGLAGSTLLFLRLGGPVIALFDGAANRLVKRLGIEPIEELSGAVDIDELGHIIASAGRQGALDPGLAQLLARTLEFRERRAADVLVPRPQVVGIPAGATALDLQVLAVRTGHSRFPVVGDGLDDVRGVVGAKEVLRIPPAERATTGIADLAERELAVPERAPLADVLADLRERRTQMAVVVDEYGGTAGILTLEDIVEELVGAIEDEYDVSSPDVVSLPGGGFRVPGGWRIDEVARDTGVTLPEGDFETVGGLVMASLGRVPQPGDAVTVAGATVTVEAMDGHAVTAVVVRSTAGGP